MKKIEAVGIVLYNETHHIFLAKRPKGKALADKWEFPGGKIEPGESLEECIIREIKEELCITCVPTDYLGKRTFVYDYGEVTLHLFMGVSEEFEKIQLVEHQESQWAKPNDLSLLDVPEITLPFIKDITHYMERLHVNE